MDISKRFDKVAKEYDTPDKLERSQKIVEFLSRNLPITRTWKVLDFGCGTGTTALLLSPFVKSIVGVDLSKGMLDVFQKKIKDFNVKNIDVKNKDILNGDFGEKDFDLIITAMTFHHLKNPEKAFKKLSNYLKKGGYLAVIDLEKEDGTFHSDNTDVKHFGFDNKEIENWFENKEFNLTTVQTFYEIKKERNGKLRKYPVFIAIAERK